MASTNFNAVRSGYKSLPQFIDILLDTAHLPGQPLIVNMAGNAFYVDLASDGDISVMFQGYEKAYSNPYIRTPPGSIFEVPFTQIAITNTAQPGKFMRLVYGVDLDFKPGSSSAVQISGSLAPIEVYEQSGAINSQGAVSVGVASAVIVAAGTKKKVLLQNTTGTDVYLAFGVAATVGTGSFLLPANSQQGFDNITDEIRAIVAAGTADVWAGVWA